MRPIFVLALVGSLLPLAAATAPVAPAERATERQTIGEKQVPVSARKEITIAGRQDADVKTRELWYRQAEAAAAGEADRWGPWQKHGISFARETPITWAPVEGRWQIHLRYEEISGGFSGEPTSTTAGAQEFIIDRSVPAVAISFPPDGAKLRGGQRYTITWKATDPHLHSQGIALKWARDNGANPTVIEGAGLLANSGSFEWTTPQDMTNAGVLVIEASDKAGNTGSARVGNLVIDAIAPSRSITGPAISAAREVPLAITCQDAGPAGLASVQLFFSADNGAAWTAGPEIKEGFTSLPWTAPADGRYLLHLVATDGAGNANARPAGQQAGAFALLVDTEAPVVALASAIGLVDPGAAANAPQRKVFKPGDAVEVRFTLKEPNPAPTGVTILLQTEAGGRWAPIGQNLPPDRAFAWTIPDLSTQSARIRVEAVDLAGNRGQVEAAEVYRIDNQVEAGEVEVEL